MADAVPSHEQSRHAGSAVRGVRAVLVHSESVLRVLSEASETQRCLGLMYMSADLTKEEWRSETVIFAYMTVHAQCTLSARSEHATVHAQCTLRFTWMKSLISDL